MRAIGKLNYALTTWMSCALSWSEPVTAS